MIALFVDTAERVGEVAERPNGREDHNQDPQQDLDEAAAPPPAKDTYPLLEDPQDTPPSTLHLEAHVLSDGENTTWLLVQLVATAIKAVKNRPVLIHGTDKRVSWSSPVNLVIPRSVAV